MSIEYFIVRLMGLEEWTWASCWVGDKNPRLDTRRVAESKGKKRLIDLLSQEEYDTLICILGHHLKAVNDGELDYFMLGSTPKERVLAQLRWRLDFPPYAPKPEPTQSGVEDV